MSYLRLYTGLLAATWVTALVVAVTAWPPLRALAGLPLVLLLPGALVTYAAIPPDSGVDWRLRSVLSVAVSISFALLVSLALALAFDEVSQGAVALGLGVIGTTAGVIAVARDLGEVWFEPPTLPHVSPAVALVSALLLLACAAITVRTLNVDALPGEFTALTLTQRGGIAHLEVENHQDQSVRYRYMLRGDGRLLRTGLISAREGRNRAVLAPIPAGIGRLRGVLYLDGRNPYRAVSLRVKRRSASTSTAAP